MLINFKRKKTSAQPSDAELKNTVSEVELTPKSQQIMNLINELEKNKQDKPNIATEVRPPQIEEQVLEPTLQQPMSVEPTEPKQKPKPKKTGGIKKIAPTNPITVTYYGQEIRRLNDDHQVYFAIDDLLNLAQPIEEGKPVSKKKDFNSLAEEVGVVIDNSRYATSKDCIQLIGQVNGRFPGSLVRWLQEA